MKLFSPIWKERFRRLARRHAIIMIMSTMETMAAEMEAATINSRIKEKDLMTIICDMVPAPDTVTQRK